MTFGTSSYGFGFAGLSGAPPTIAEPAAAEGAAFVDQNGDYQVNNTGDLVKTTHTQQRALLLLRTEFGSIWSDSSLGMQRQDAIDQTWLYRMRRAVENALLPMTSDGTIVIDKIDITRPLHFRASVVVSYTVLSTGEAEVASV